jgi:hypothetical protein
MWTGAGYSQLTFHVTVSEFYRVSRSRVCSMTQPGMRQAIHTSFRIYRILISKACFFICQLPFPAGALSLSHSLSVCLSVCLLV